MQTKDLLYSLATRREETLSRAVLSAVAYCLTIDCLLVATFIYLPVLLHLPVSYLKCGEMVDVTESPTGSSWVLGHVSPLRALLFGLAICVNIGCMRELIFKPPTMDTRLQTVLQTCVISLFSTVTSPTDGYNVLYMSERVHGAFPLMVRSKVKVHLS